MKAIFLITILIYLPSQLFGDQLRVGVSKLDSNLYPTNQNIGESNFVRNLISPPMITFNHSQKWSCLVCKEIPTQKNGMLKIDKEKLYQVSSHWTIEKAYNWDDGRPVTGFDVKYTLNVIKKEHPNLPEFRVNVDPHNPRRFILEMKNVRSDFYQLLAISLLPHRKPSLLKQKSSSSLLTYLEASRGNTYGPYKIQQAAPFKLIKNSYFNGNHSTFETISVVKVESKKELMKLVLEDRLDIIADGSFSYRDLKMLLSNKQVRENWHMRYTDSPWTDLLILNLRNPYLADQNVRKAIMHSVDQRMILSKVFDNYGHLVQIPPFMQTSNKEKYYNPELAAKILNASGWSLNNGVRTKNGAKLQLKLEYHNSPIKREIARYLKKALGNIGVQVILAPYQDQQEVLKRAKMALFRDMTLLSVKLSSGANIAELIHGDFIPRRENNYSGTNFGGWDNRKIRIAFNDLLKEFDQNKVKTIESSIRQTFINEAPWVPLAIRPQVTLIHSNIRNIQMPNKGYHSSLYISSWVKQAEKKHIF